MLVDAFLSFFALNYLKFELTFLDLLINLLLQLFTFFSIRAMNRINTWHLINCFREVVTVVAVGWFKVAATNIIQLNSWTTICITPANYSGYLIFALTGSRGNSGIVEWLIIKCYGRYLQLTSTNTHFIIWISRWT